MWYSFTVGNNGNTTENGCPSYKDILRACLRSILQLIDGLPTCIIKQGMYYCKDCAQDCIGFWDDIKPFPCAGRWSEIHQSLWVFLHHSLIQNKLLRTKFYAVKRSHHGPVETMRVISLPNLEAPPLNENFFYNHTKYCCFLLATGSVFLVLPTFHPKGHQIFFHNRAG